MTRSCLDGRGGDHREQAHALITLIEERSTTDGWGAEKLRPLLAGLLEVMPWVRQWHNEVDPAFGASPAHEYDTYLTSQQEKYGLTEDDRVAGRRQRRSAGGGGEERYDRGAAAGSRLDSG